MQESILCRPNCFVENFAEVVEALKTGRFWKNDTAVSQRKRAVFLAQACRK